MKILDHPVGDLKAYFAKGKTVLFLHHPHDTYVLLQERKPVRLWTGFGTISLQNILGLQSLLTYLLILFLLPANFSLVYFDKQ
jgi:hypothetical protein